MSIISLTGAKENRFHAKGGRLGKAIQEEETK